MGKLVCNDPGSPPDMMMLRPDQLVISEEYQRDLSKGSMIMIKAMAHEFDWEKYKALNVAPTDTPGIYEVVDGQHTAIAAKTNGLVPFLPCLMSKSFTLKEKAEDFIGINTNRIALTPMAIFNAKVAAQDDAAIAVEIAMSRSGVTLLGVPPAGNTPWGVGETMAVGSMMDIATKQGDARLSTVLRIAVLAKAAPVSALLIKALNLAVPIDCTPETRDKIVRALTHLSIKRLEVVSSSEKRPGLSSYQAMADKLADAAGLPARRMGRAAPKRSVSWQR